MCPSSAIHVVGVGNLLCGDDAVGVRAMEACRDRGGWPPEVVWVDAGTSVFDVLGALDPGRKLVVIDAVRGGGEPGTVYRVPFEALAESRGGAGALSVHEVGLLEALPLLELSGRRWDEVVVIGVEPEHTTFGAELSPRVAAALPTVARTVESEVAGAKPALG